MTAENNMELMQSLDDAWNAQDLDTFSQRHKGDTVVRWPGQPPTHGIDNHRAEAIAFFKAQKPDVVLLDVDMPGTNGIEALKAIRKINDNIPVIMFSTLTVKG
ncbi:MAG: response regulator, partial [Chloroflexi bacterium]|nr:response regulator [Chloroflexota bacterium]